MTQCHINRCDCLHIRWNCNCHTVTVSSPFVLSMLRMWIRVLISDVVRYNAGDVCTVCILCTCYGCFNLYVDA